MARNAEKAMTALARWRRMKEQEEKGPTVRRPADTRDCTNVADADRFRKEVVMDISKKIAIIQNPGLGEFKIRDLNDDINRLLRIKYAWESRIKELGGADYRRIAPKALDKEGREVAGSRGYKYFGAAKDLPGVRDLFDKGVNMDAPKKNRSELVRNVDADYYGYLDDDDGLLIPLEEAEERVAIARALEQWKNDRDQGVLPVKRRHIDDDDDDDIYRIHDQDDDESKSVQTVIVGEDGRPTYIQHVPVPSQKEIEEALLERKKAELLDKYVNDTLKAQSSAAQTLMGYQQHQSTI